MNGVPNINEIGKRGECLAARYLRRHGFRILARNVHCGRNELDLIAQNKEYVIFVEVKTRRVASLEDAEANRPSLAVNAGKRRRTLDAAYEYLRTHPNKRCPRMDVIEVYLDEARRPHLLRIHHIVCAFDAHGQVH